MPTLLIRNLLLILLPAVLFSCFENKDLKIIPLSPYKDVSKDSQAVTNRYLFAVDGFNDTKKNKDSLDKFVLKKLPDSLLKDDQVIIFLFYEYEKGKLDENFKHDEYTKQNNIFMEAGKLLVRYRWLHGKFMAVTYYKNGAPHPEDRNW